MDIQGFFKTYGVAPKEVEEITRAFDVHRYKPDEIVFREGDEPGKLFFINKGSALVTRKDRGGEEEILNVLKEGQYFGEIGITQDIPRTATVKAIGTLELLEMNAERSRKFLEAYPSFAGMMKKIGIRRLLGLIPIFKGLDEKKQGLLMDILVEENRAENEVIFKEHDPSDALYIIVKGGVRVYKKTQYGKEITLAYLSQNDFFGEQGLIESLPRSATVVAVEPSRFLVIRREPFQVLLKKNALLSFNILKELSRRMREVNREVSMAKSISFFKGMTIITRPDRCLSCRSCEIACAVAKSRARSLYDAIKEDPLPVKRIWVRKYHKGSEPLIRPEHCVQCKEAYCLHSCKFSAVKRDRATGTISIIEKKCVGCGLCARACPYNVISVIRIGNKKRMALKCTYCMEHQEGPACVRSCPSNALVVALAPSSGYPGVERC